MSCLGYSRLLDNAEFMPLFSGNVLKFGLQDDNLGIKVYLERFWFEESTTACFFFSYKSTRCRARSLARFL